MKKLQLFIIFILTALSVSSQLRDSDGITWTAKCDSLIVKYNNGKFSWTQNLELCNNSIRIIVTPSSDSYWKVKVYNDSAQVVRVIWDEGSFGNMKLVDGGMRAFQINDPISPSLLYKNGEVEKTVMNYDMVEHNSKPIWNIKIGGDVQLILPIEIEGKRHIYYMDFHGIKLPKKKNK